MGPVCGMRSVRVELIRFGAGFFDQQITAKLRIFPYSLVVTGATRIINPRVVDLFLDWQQSRQA